MLGAAMVRVAALLLTWVTGFSGLVYEVTLNPSHGQLTGTLPDLIYTPSQDYNGADSFLFRVDDGTELSSEALVSITVNEINDPPVVLVLAETTAVDTPVRRYRSEWVLSC